MNSQIRDILIKLRSGQRVYVELINGNKLIAKMVDAERVKIKEGELYKYTDTLDNFLVRLNDTEIVKVI